LTLACKTILIDDERLALELLEKLLNEFPEIQTIGTFTNPIKGLEAIIKLQPDLLFLDIDMPAKNGLEIIHDLRELDIKPKTIFITAHNNFAIQALRESAYDFLTKPIDKDELKESILRFLKNKSKETINNNENYISLLNKLSEGEKVKFNTRSGFILIDPEEIVFLKAEGNYCNLRLSTGRNEFLALNLGKVERLLNQASFVRIDRSTIININYLKKVNRKERTCDLLTNNETISLKLSKKSSRLLEALLGV